MSLIRKQDTQSLLVNSHFSSGLFGWGFSGSVRHSTFPQAGNGTFTPEFGAIVSAGAKIEQVITRTDMYSYPSRRFIENVRGTPIGENTILLTAVPGDEGSKFDPPVPVEQEDMRTLSSGSQIGLRDLELYDRSDSYRVGPLPIIADQYTAEVSPLSDPVPHTVSSTNFAGASITLESVSSATMTVLGKYGSITPGQVVIITEPVFAVAKITSVVTQSDRRILGLRNVAGGEFFEFNASVPYVSPTAWFIADRRLFNVFYDAAKFRYEFTLAMSVKDGVLPAAPPLLSLIPVSVVSNVAVEGDPVIVPAATLDGGGLVEVMSTTKGTAPATVWSRLIYRFSLELDEPIIGYAKLSIAAPANHDLIVGQVSLYKGNYSSRHEFYLDDTPGKRDGVPYPTEKPNPIRVNPANNTDALDRLFHGADDNCSAIPKGSILLHLGEACPPGFKRVDSGPNSTKDGVGDSIPRPDTAEYDADRDRTILVWNNKSFDFIGSDGHPIPIASDQFEYTEQIPTTVSMAQWNNNRTEIITYGPNQPKIQPGMSIRVRASDVSQGRGREMDYSAVVRQVAVSRKRGTKPTEYYASSGFDIGEFDIPPVGPHKDSALQNAAVQASATGTIQRGNDVIHLYNVTTTNMQVYVGRVLYVRWTHPAYGGLTHGFVGILRKADLVFSETSTGHNLDIARYDGQPMVVDETDASVPTTFVLSAANIFPPSAVVTRTYTVQAQTIRSIIWAVREFIDRTEISVNGDVVSDVLSFNSTLTIEPTGYLRFGNPTDYFSYGTMGHSHELTRGDAVVNSNIAPVSMSGGYNIPEIAREHGHGFMPKHAYPLPKFVAYLVCERV